MERDDHPRGLADRCTSWRRPGSHESQGLVDRQGQRSADTNSAATWGEAPLRPEQGYILRTATVYIQLKGA